MSQTKLVKLLDLTKLNTTILARYYRDRKIRNPTEIFLSSLFIDIFIFFSLFHCCLFKFLLKKIRGKQIMMFAC